MYNVLLRALLLPFRQHQPLRLPVLSVQRSSRSLGELPQAWASGAPKDGLAKEVRRGRAYPKHLL